MGPIKEENKRRFILEAAFIAAVCAVLWFTLRYLLAWVMPFLIGYIIAAIVQPATWFLHKKLHIPRKGAGVFSVLVFLILIAAFLTFGVSWLLHELAAVFSMLPSLTRQFQDSLVGLTGRLSGFINQFPTEISQQVTNAVSDLAEKTTKLSSYSTGAASAVWNAAVKVPGVLLSVIITIVAACFISSDYPKIRGFFMRQLPAKYQEWAMDLKEFFFITVARLIRAYLTLMLITFAELCVGLSLIRVPHSIVVAAIIAIVDILPVLGTGTVMIPWAVVELVIGQQFRGAELLVLYVIIAVVRNTLEPKIVGHHIGLYPLVTLISMYIGLQAFGGPGLILFPLLTIVIKHMHDTGKIRFWND